MNLDYVKRVQQLQERTIETMATVVGDALPHIRGQLNGLMEEHRAALDDIHEQAARDVLSGGGLDNQLRRAAGCPVPNLLLEPNDHVRPLTEELVLQIRRVMFDPYLKTHNSVDPELIQPQNDQLPSSKILPGWYRIQNGYGLKSELLCFTIPLYVGNGCLHLLHFYIEPGEVHLSRGNLVDMSTYVDSLNKWIYHRQFQCVDWRTVVDRLAVLLLLQDTNRQELWRPNVRELEELKTAVVEQHGSYLLKRPISGVEPGTDFLYTVIPTDDPVVEISSPHAFGPRSQTTPWNDLLPVMQNRIIDALQERLNTGK